MANYRSFICLRCRQPGQNLPYSRKSLCRSCLTAHTREQQRAVSAVQQAVKRGLIPRAKECECVDCAKPAHDYDHRDCSKPLEIEPVCRSCNLKRGIAYDSVYQPSPIAITAPISAESSSSVGSALSLGP